MSASVAASINRAAPGKISPAGGKFSRSALGALPEGLAARAIGWIGRAYPGADPVEVIAAETWGLVSRERAKKWRQGRATPSGAAMLILCAAFGPDFTAAAYGPACPDWLAREARLDRLEREAAEGRRARAAAEVLRRR